MTRKSDSTAAATSKENVILLGGAEPETLRTIGGSKSDRFNTALINSMVNSGWFPPGIADEDRNRLIFVAVTGLQAFKPTDEIEGLPRPARRQTPTIRLRSPSWCYTRDLEIDSRA